MVLLELLHVFDGDGGVHAAVSRDDFVERGVDVLGYAFGVTVDEAHLPSFVGRVKDEFTAIIEAAPEGGFGRFARKSPAPTGRAKRWKKPRPTCAKRSA